MAFIAMNYKPPMQFIDELAPSDIPPTADWGFVPMPPPVELETTAEEGTQGYAG